MFVRFVGRRKSPAKEKLVVERKCLKKKASGLTKQLNLILSKKREGFMEKYKCLVCGYVYDPEKGDPDNGVPPKTVFADIDDSWVCPECGVGKDQFEKID